MSSAPTPYETLVQKIRRQREQELRDADRGWLTLAGLFHLHEGENPFGCAPENDIVLPCSILPAKAGVFILKDGKVSIRPNPGLPILCNGVRPTAESLATDQDETPDFLTVGQFTMVALQRGSDYYIRLWDQDHLARKNFTGLRYYPINPALRINAEFTPYNPPRFIVITDVLGNEHEVPHTGYVTFEREGQECRLHALGDQSGLYFSFRDDTNGNSTYGGGRELEAGLPSGGVVQLDFNLAYNPPCAYTDFATCPLPPPENTLPVRIEAGELTYRADH